MDNIEEREFKSFFKDLSEGNESRRCNYTTRLDTYGTGEELSSYPDVTNETIKRAQETGKIIVYSSYPIENGNFVTPSRMQARDYAGGGMIYSKEVSVSDVAWINVNEGQFAKIRRK